MALIDNLVTPDLPQVCYLWEKSDSIESYWRELKGGRAHGGLTKEELTFQYWPESLQDDYQVEWAEHMVPGGSHPLYQYVGGRGRTISFQAVFTSEINTKHRLFGQTPSPQITPSRIYTVDVSAALNRLRSWLVPGYPNGDSGGAVGSISPPPRLGLAFPNTGLGGTAETITVILRNAPITIESWFPNGQIRIATVDLAFNEVVQSSVGGSNSSSVRFIDRSTYADASETYEFKGASNRPLIGGL